MKKHKNYRQYHKLTFLTITIIAFILIGDGLRDALDPEVM